ncbi:hypothetical protein [Mesorhizobium sp. M0910]|uniref:hypothetical protein n=1 Tax=Mesorhizobium sp. M0910 TaxID=2957025 RepID=UPI00333A07A6
MDNHPQLKGRFTRRAKASGKPVLLLKPGKSAEGMQAAMSHSGRITGRRDIQQVRRYR